MIHPHTLTINHLSSMTTSSGPPTPTPLSEYTQSLTQSSTSTESSTSTNRAYRTFKRKFPNHPFTTKPGTAKEYIDHPKHKKTNQFLQTNLPSFPQYTLNTPTTNDDITNFVDEYVLMPTLHWTSYYHYTNPLYLPLYNTTNDNGQCKNMLYRLTTALTLRQFTYIGFKKLLKEYTAPRANDFTIEYYDHNIIRPNQDLFLDDDRFANPHLTEKFFISTPFIFTLNIFDKKHDHIISEALINTQAYQSFQDKFDLFTLTFHFLTPQERDLLCSHDIMLRTKQTHSYTYYRFIQNHFHLTQDPPGIENTENIELQVNHINCESTDSESDTDNNILNNMITVDNDYESIIYEEPFSSHIYENQLELLNNYYLGPNNNSTQTTQESHRIQTENSFDKDKAKNLTTNHIYQNIQKEQPREKIWTIPFLLESPKNKEFQPPDLEIDFLIDSGAESNIINIPAWNEIKLLHPNLKPLETSSKLATSQGSMLTNYGKIQHFSKD